MLPGVKRNVGKGERVISSLAGMYLVYKGLSEKKTPLSVAGGLLLARGVLGYCPFYSSFNINNAKPPAPVVVKTSITVNKPREEVYAFWRRLDNLPYFMKHLERVEVLDEKQTSWKAKIPGGMGTIDWTSEIIEDDTNVRLAWRSVEGSNIENAGVVAFKDAGKFGTEVHAEIAYQAPAGNIGAGLAKLLNPILEGMIKEDIKNFRRYIETGEIPTIKGQASGRNK